MTSKYAPALPSVPKVLVVTPVGSTPSASGCPATLESEVSNLYVLSSTKAIDCPSTPLTRYLFTF